MTLGISTRTLFLTLLVGFLSDSAQASVNVELEREDADHDGFSGELGWSLDGGLGNVVDLSFGLDGNLALRKGDNLWMLLTSGEFASEHDADGIQLFDEESRYANEMTFHLRFNHNLNDRWTIETFTQSEYDQFLLLDRRLLAGTGGRWTITSSEDGLINLGLAYMLEHEHLDPSTVIPSEVDTLAHRASCYISALVALSSNIEIGGAFYAQPRLTDFSDVRFFGEGWFEVGVTDRLALETSMDLRHDSDPPMTIEEEDALDPFDLDFEQAFVWSF
ncbi:MAG: DUF481 domain-containing protein [Myxococcota bacterium]|nr:DUF481 domain-containing protein [Myxococcota bacterium]